jgi:hypothetical protein
MNSDNTPTSIWVTYSFVGFHSWPDATPSRAYLAARHRHNFGVRVDMEVLHDNREVEFHDLIDACKYHLNDVPEGGQSCEHMARHLLDNLAIEYPNRVISVSVDEDDECGATVATCA